MTADGSSAPRIDASVLSTLVVDLGADHVAELCQLFLAEAGERLDAVRSACEAGDSDAAARSAHRLKSACGFVGALAMSGLCREVEHLAGAGRLDDVRSLLDPVTAELEATSVELAALVGTLSADVHPGPTAAVT